MLVGKRLFRLRSLMSPSERIGCWVSARHSEARIFEEVSASDRVLGLQTSYHVVPQYMWMWIAAFTNIVLYIPLYFCVRGNIRVNPTTKRISFNFDGFHVFGCCRRKARIGWDIMRGTGGSSINGSTMSPPKATHSKEALKLIW